MEKCVSKKLGEIHSGTKCLFQKGGKKRCVLCMWLPGFVPKPRSLDSAWVLSKQQSRLITAHNICSHFQQVHGRWPSPESHVSLGVPPQ